LHRLTNGNRNHLRRTAAGADPPAAAGNLLGFGISATTRQALASRWLDTAADR
jgi:hypothetical protein